MFMKRQFTLQIVRQRTTHAIQRNDVGTNTMPCKVNNTIKHVYKLSLHTLSIVIELNAC